MWNWFWNIVGKKAVEPPPIKNEPMLLIDISRNNGVIDFAKVKADPQGIKGVIIKATEGATVRDKKLWVNMEGCAKNGLQFGVYHFATFNDDNEVLDATTEARFFLSVVKASPYRPQLPLVLDIESNKPIPYTKQEMIVYISTFREIIQSNGYELAIYSSPGFLQSYLPENHPFTDLRLWVADYSGDINHVPGWSTIWMRQTTDKGKVQGISTAVDMNHTL